MDKTEVRLKRLPRDTVDDSTREREVRSDEMAVPRRCTLEGFADEVAEAGGVDLLGLEPLTHILVRTENSLYDIYLLEPPDPKAVVRGGRFFIDPTEASLTGSSFGGNLLKRGWIGYGMRMEIYVDGRRIVTSPVKTVEILTQDAVPGPF
jgi:hypothetical protein